MVGDIGKNKYQDVTRYTRIQGTAISWRSWGVCATMGAIADGNDGIAESARPGAARCDARAGQLVKLPQVHDTPQRA